MDKKEKPRNLKAESCEEQTPIFSSMEINSNSSLIAFDTPRGHNLKFS